MTARLSKLEKICAKNPTSILFARLAEGYLQEGQAKRAFEICRQGLRYRPSYVAGHLVMGKCHLVSGRFEEARGEFQKVLQLDPDNVAAFWHLGQIDLEMGWEDLALRNFECAFVLDPFNRELEGQIGALQKTEHADPTPDSIPEPNPPEVQEEAVEQDKPGQGLANLVLEIENLHDAPEEDPLLEKGIAEPIATVTLAELYAGQGLKQQALEILERVLEKEPENSQAKARLEALRSSEG